MNIPLILASIFILGVVSTQPGADNPARVAYCELAKDEKSFADRIVETRARLVKLKNGEWAIDGPCIRPTLLVFPSELSPTPSLQLEASPGVQMLRGVQRERGVFFEADFVGRFDWHGETPPTTKKEAIVTYGKSRLARRLVLINVLNPERLVVPKR
jgi:hypothetical protein